MQVQPFDQFLGTQSSQVPVYGFMVNLLLAAILTYILGLVYIHFGTSLSNRRTFARQFLIVGMTTMFIITVVKSSLALSLGLVGALSIVRFRTAIKEPEELAFLFITIAIGLGLGADQRNITIIAVSLIILIIFVRSRFIHKEIYDQNLHLTVSSHNPNKIGLSQIISILDKHCSSVDLKRFDETNEVLEASFLVKFPDFEKMNSIRDDLSALSKSIKITFLDNSRI